MSEEKKFATALVHLGNASEKMKEAFELWEKDEIGTEELEKRLQNAMPDLEQMGYRPCEEGEDTVTINRKPVPKNAESAIYFYKDDDNNLQAVVRILNYEDNAEIDTNVPCSIAEIAACEVIKLVYMEHQHILNQISMAMALERVKEAGIFNTESDTASDDDPLSGIEDEETRNIVRDFMKKH